MTRHMIALLATEMEEAHQRLRRRLEGLTDEEFFWEPVPGCWTVHTSENGRWIVDYADPAPEPPPFTTIAWRLVHVAACKAMYHEYAFGPERLTWDELEIPHTVAATLAWLEEGHARLQAALAELTDADLETMRATNWGVQWPAWRIFWAMISHDLHHGAEIGCLRDLYRTVRRERWPRMDNHTLWNLADEAEDAIVAQYEPVFNRFSADSGLDDAAVGLLLAVITFEPETTTPARLLVRGPYTAATTYLARLAAATEKGYMTEVSPGEYRLNDLGRTEVQRLVEEARTVMAQVDPLPLADSQRLTSLLDRIVQASLNTPPPPDTWSIRLSHKLMPAVSPPLPYLEQAISCLRGYRDDAHLAAWQPSGLSAAALETLTLLWRGEADSLAAVCQRLSRRGHSPDVYVAALKELRERGFVKGPDTAPRLTEAGRIFREQVERDTDRYFFAPWVCLDEAQRIELAEWLTRLRDGLRESRP